MGLFRHRPLCFFCFLFVLASVLLCYVGYSQKIILISVLLILLAICAVFALIAKKHRIRALSVLFCVLFVLIAHLNSFFGIDYRQKQANKYCGGAQVCVSVLAQEYSSKNTSVYTVRIENIYEESVSIKALMVCAFQAELGVGDRVFADAELMDTSDRALGMTFAQRSDEPDILLGVVLYESEGVLVDRFDRNAPLLERLLSKNGFLAVSHDVKQALLSRIDRILGEEVGGVAKGFLLGEKSDMPTDVIRDFRRSGVSHLFAVSGLHISILIGFAELILRRLRVHKYIRCAINSALAFVLLVLTGFSMSAMRAVLMLWLAYLIFMLSDEADSPTTLFVAVCAILLIFPYSVYSLGLWMSFLATLGLVTLYPIVERILPRTKKKERKTLSGSLLELLRKLCLAVSMTLICNMFLLPIQWSVFGEISVASVPANLALTPLTPAFLALCVLALIFGSIAPLGAMLSALCGAVCRAILWVVGRLSSWSAATVSLRYFFVDALVIVFTVLAIAVLVIKLRRKYLIAVPFVAFVLTFSSCVTAYNIAGPQTAQHYYDDQNEIVALCDTQRLCIIDMSNGAYFRFPKVLAKAAESGATSIDKLVLTELTAAHVSTMDYLLRSQLVEQIYIPYPQDEGQIELSRSLAVIADECSVNMVLYTDGEIISHYGTSLCVFMSEVEGKTCRSVFVGGEKELVGFVDAFSDGAADAYVRACDTLVVANKKNIVGSATLHASDGATVIYLDESVMKLTRLDTDALDIYVNKKKENLTRIRLD